MTDSIYVNELRVACRIGVSVAERRKPQEVVVGLSLFMDLKAGSSSGSLSHTVDYRKVRTRVAEVAASREFHLLESLAEAVASAMLENRRVERVVVNVRKAKYAESPSIGIEIERKAERLA